MEILEESKTTTREGFDSYYFKVLNNRGKEYNCSITIYEKKIVRINCECMHQVWEISRKVKTGKMCRHIKFCLEKLKEEKVI
jgi:hypothetical protein